MKFDPNALYRVFGEAVAKADGRGTSCRHTFKVVKNAVDYNFCIHATFDRKRKLDDTLTLLREELARRPFLRRTNVELVQRERQDKTSYSGQFEVVFQVSCTRGDRDQFASYQSDRP